MGIQHILFVVINTILILIVNNALKSFIVVREMNECAKQFDIKDILADHKFNKTISELDNDFGVIMLNRYALDITLNWMCNVEDMINFEKQILFFTLDHESERILKSKYPNVKVYTWYAPCLSETFIPGDATYMSFFLLRTTLIRILLRLKRTFWMLQADTIWTKSLFEVFPQFYNSNASNVFLDQSGYQNSDIHRKHVMNGANFLVVSNPTTNSFVEDLNWYQTHFYVTDPDAIKIICANQQYLCTYIDHRFISGWEWVYGDQTNPPALLQMDGETEGGKKRTMGKYKMWFLNEDKSCNKQKVASINKMMKQGKVPQLFSSSKLKQKLLLFIGQTLAQIPVFGHWYSIYGGLPSLTLQFF